MLTSAPCVPMSLAKTPSALRLKNLRRLRFYTRRAIFISFPPGEGANMGVLKVAFLFLRALFVPRLKLAVENLALRQQLVVLQRSSK